MLKLHNEDESVQNELKVELLHEMRIKPPYLANLNLRHGRETELPGL